MEEPPLCYRALVGTHLPYMGGYVIRDIYDLLGINEICNLCGKQTRLTKLKGHVPLKVHGNGLRNIAKALGFFHETLQKPVLAFVPQYPTVAEGSMELYLGHIVNRSFWRNLRPLCMFIQLVHYQAPIPYSWSMVNISLQSFATEAGIFDPSSIASTTR